MSAKSDRIQWAADFGEGVALADELLAEVAEELQPGTPAQEDVEHEDAEAELPAEVQSVLQAFVDRSITEADARALLEPFGVDLDQIDFGDLDPRQAPPATSGPDLVKMLREIPDGFRLCPTCIGQLIVPEDPPLDPSIHACRRCQGHGEVRTGSFVGGKQALPCPDCHGDGYLVDGPDVPPTLPVTGSDFLREGELRDHAGRSPADPDFDWSRVVQAPAPQVAEPAPAPAPVV